MESSKNNTQVIIDGKVLTLSGFESEEYLQQVASYLNNKIDECKSKEGFNRQSLELRNIVISLNIADDYFKAKSRGQELEKDLERSEKENYDLKHELVAAQMNLEKARKLLDEQKKELGELQKNVIKLEAGLEKDK